MRAKRNSKPRLMQPLAEVFDKIGMDLCILICKEVRHTEPLAARFCTEYPKLTKSKRNPIDAAEMIANKELDTGKFANMLVKHHRYHQQRLAAIDRDAKLPVLTQVSVIAAKKEGNFEERRPHLEKGGIIDSPKSGTSIAINSGNTMQNNFGLPSFEESTIDLEEKMKALGPAKDYVDAEWSEVDNKVKETV